MVWNVKTAKCLSDSEFLPLMEEHLELSKIIQALERTRQAWPERVCIEK